MDFQTKSKLQMLTDIIVVLKFVIKLYRQIMMAKADADMREAIDAAKKLKDTSKLERLISERMRDS